jgi:LemA protein
MNIEQKTEVNRQMDELAGRINVLAEAYPDLKASVVFKELQGAISEVEEHLQAARRIYNMNVSSFNQLLASWPSGVVGGGHGHAPKEFFEAEERKKTDVKMEF